MFSKEHRAKHPGKNRNSGGQVKVWNTEKNITELHLELLETQFRPFISLQKDLQEDLEDLGLRLKLLFGDNYTTVALVEE